MNQTNRKVGLIILAMMLGMFMTSLDNTIVSASIASVLKDLSGFEKMSWVFTAYMLASTSTMMIFGKLSDLFGRKRFYLIGIFLFLVGSALCGVAHNMEEFIVFRAIQGIGAGALFPISFTILFTLFSDPKQAAKLSGVFVAVFGLSSVLGPQLGTWITESFGWRWCFYVNIPFGLLAFFVLAISLKETRSNIRPSVDYIGTVLLISATVSTMLALTWGGQQYAWSSWQVLTLFTIAAITTSLFILVEMKAKEPILPLQLFRNRIVTCTGIISFCQGAIMFASITYLPIFAVGVLGQANSNSILTPMMLSVMIGATLYGFLMPFFSYRVLMGSSMLMSVVSAYLLKTVGFDASKGHMIILMIILGLLAIGPLMSVAQNAIAANVDPRYMGISSSFVSFWRNIGAVLGTSVTATLVNTDLKQRLLDGAAALHIPQNKVEALANPQVIMNAGSQMPAEMKHFIREALGNAIHHGYTASLVLSIVGLLTALFMGPGKFERKPVEKEVKEQSLQA
ncbi:MDR family MFS transporter [Microbacteriaceae bacterium 4G12]